MGRPPKGGLPKPPSHPTISRFWTYYKLKNKLRYIRGKRLTDWILAQFGERRMDPESPKPELEHLATAEMASQGIVMPSAYRFRRSLASAIRSFRNEDCEKRVDRLGLSLGVSIRDLPIAKRWTAANELLRFSPAHVGKANIPKMVEEYRIYNEISKVLVQNKLEPAILLANPDCERLFRFVENRRPSLLEKWERRKVLEALPFYLAGRLQESIDAILLCFIRKARLLRSRITEEVEDTRREESLALLERSEPHLRALQFAIAKALATGTPEPLKPFQRRIHHIHKAGKTTLDRHRLYRLIGSRGTYTRKLARRLVGLELAGREPHAHALVKILPEVFRFAPFDEEIPSGVVKQLQFLEVPADFLRQRRVFEPAVLITLADYLWAGRVTVSLSRRFSNMWGSIPSRKPDLNAHEWVRDRRLEFNRNWGEFERCIKGSNLVENGRLRIRRPRRLFGKRYERILRKRHDALVNRIPPVPILKLIFSVHKATGLLDAFQLPFKHPHKLDDEQRTRLAAGVLVSLGMNIGIRDMASVMGRDYQIGRIQHFTDYYMTKENLESALSRLLKTWDDRQLGLRWGPGKLVSVDGRVVGAFQNNILSRFHYRRGRSGMTVYWFRRDDGLSTRVKVLGNQEWEAWHVLDELLHPLTGHDLHASCGDTQGQFLSLWALAELTGKEILARFRRPSTVNLYKPDARNRAGLRNLRVVRWDIVENCLPGILRLVEAIKDREMTAADVFRRWHLFDEDGHDIATGLRELGKVKRTEFLLEYAHDQELQRKIQKACNDAEAWNSFHEAIFWGNGGKLRSNDPIRQEQALLALTILMDAIVFYTASRYMKELKKARSPTPVIWDHIQLLGRYQFKKGWISG